jgi:hypothetical protein
MLALVTYNSEPETANVPAMIKGNTPLRIGWSDLNNVQEAGQYPFRDGVITVLELEIAIWRKHPEALFTLMRKNPIRDRVEYVLGKHEFPGGDVA